MASATHTLTTLLLVCVAKEEYMKVIRTLALLAMIAAGVAGVGTAHSSFAASHAALVGQHGASPSLLGSASAGSRLTGAGRIRDEGICRPPVCPGVLPVPFIAGVPPLTCGFHGVTCAALPTGCADVNDLTGCPLHLPPCVGACPYSVLGVVASCSGAAPPFNCWG